MCGKFFWNTKMLTVLSVGGRSTGDFTIFILSYISHNQHGLLLCSEINIECQGVAPVQDPWVESILYKASWPFPCFQTTDTRAGCPSGIPMQGTGAAFTSKMNAGISAMKAHEPQLSLLLGTVPT
jgi:hypothetical protein